MCNVRSQIDIVCHYTLRSAAAVADQFLDLPVRLRPRAPWNLLSDRFVRTTLWTHSSQWDKHDTRIHFLFIIVIHMILLHKISIAIIIVVELINDLPSFSFAAVPSCPRRPRAKTRTARPLNRNGEARDNFSASLSGHPSVKTDVRNTTKENKTGDLAKILLFAPSHV